MQVYQVPKYHTICRAAFSFAENGLQRTNLLSGINMPMPDILSAKGRTSIELKASYTGYTRVEAALLKLLSYLIGEENLTPLVRFLDHYYKVAFERDYGYGQLPDLVMHKILDNLSFSEAMKAGRVCKQWYKCSRSMLKKNVEIKIKNTSEIPSLLKSLPRTLRSLKLLCPPESSQVYFLIEELFSSLKRQCPDLQTLSIEYGNIFYDRSDFIAKIGLLNTLYFSLQITELGVWEPEIFFDEDQFFAELKYPDFDQEKDNKMRSDLIPNSITTLRFKKALLDPRFFSHALHSESHIKVLDLSYCPSLTDEFIKLFPSLSLPKIEELYVTGSLLTDLGMSNLLSKTVNLKKLDIEDWNIGPYTFTKIKETLSDLTELYLGRTNILSDNAVLGLLYILSRESASNLKTVCLENSRLLPPDYENLKNVVHFKVIRGIPQLNYRQYDKEIRCCDHFSKNHI